MEFQGFRAAHFELFEIPDFAGRMGALRAELRPQLVALGEDLATPLSRLTGLPCFAHPAQHLRRRVNPPVQSWVAFGREKSGYKRWAHYRVAVAADGVRVSVFVEDDADDKPGFAARLGKGAAALLRELGSEPVEWYTLSNAGAPPRTAVARKELVETAARLARLKGLKFEAGVSLPREEALAMAPAEFQRWALGRAAALLPLYLLAAGAATPRPVPG